MKFLTVTELKVTATEIIRKILENREGVIVIRNGHPVVIIKPVNEEDFTLKEEGETSQIKKRG